MGGELVDAGEFGEVGHGRAEGLCQLGCGEADSGHFGEVGHDGREGLCHVGGELIAAGEFREVGHGDRFCSWRAVTRAQSD